MAGVNPIALERNIVDIAHFACQKKKSKEQRSDHNFKKFIAPFHDCFQSEMHFLICRFHIALGEQLSVVLQYASWTFCEKVRGVRHQSMYNLSTIFRQNCHHLVTQQCGQKRCCLTPHILSFCASIHPNFDRMKATRVGEAKNPGPEEKSGEQYVTMSVCNPHAILSHKKELLAHKSQMIFASETSATIAVQHEFSKNIGYDNYTCYWSEPVASRFATRDDSFSLRGESLGTAIITSLPSRKLRTKINPEFLATCRISAGVVQFAGADILVISLYGYPAGTSDRKRLNDLLLARAYDLVTKISLPFIIGGDFNTPPTELPSFSAFRNLGTCEAFEYCQRILGYQLPPTCRGATRNDTMIFHPFISQFVRKMEVRDDLKLDVHTPLLVYFDVKIPIPPRYRWKIPESWAMFDLKSELFEECYRKVRSKHKLEGILDDQTIDVECMLKHWSRSIEQAVDMTLQIQHKLNPTKCGVPGLPKSCKGRCDDRPLQKVTVVKSPKKDNHTGYEPEEEIFRMKTKQKVKQCRRIRTLLKGIHAVSSFSQEDHRVDEIKNSLQQQWDAILKAQGYPGSWMKWIMGFHDVTYIPYAVPSYDLLHALAQITEHDCAIACKEETSNRSKNFKRKIQLDLKEGSGKMVYRMVRGSQPKTLQGIPKRTSCSAVLLRQPRGKSTLKLNEDCEFSMNSKAFFGEAEVQLHTQNGRFITLSCIQGSIPSNGILSQDSYAYQPNEIFAEFSKYWSPMWLRETANENLDDEAWSSFLQEMSQVTLPAFDIQVELDNPQRWVETIRNMKSGTAHGICGWRAEELKMLPFVAIEDMAKIFKKIWPSGFPPSMLRARTVLLAKNSDPRGIEDGRPITILSVLVRMASKLVADQVLKQLSLWLPSGISGGLPNKGVKDLSLLQQFAIEKALHSSSTLGGFTLDLSKAFNRIPRKPLKFLFQAFGIPSEATDFWFANLEHLVRLPQCKGTLGPEIASSAGIPEGDAMSVLGMVILSSAYYYRIKTPTVMPFAYADNWSWLSQDQKDMMITLQKVLNFAKALRLEIDFLKSWSWGSTKDFRQTCELLNLMFPDGTIAIPVKVSAKDLGYQIHYNKHMTLESIADRIKEGTRRCERLKWIPMSITQKAKIIQTSIWPAALHSADTQVVSPKHFRTLRRAATVAMVGDHKLSSSMLACSVFGKILQDPLLFTILQTLRAIRRMAATHMDFARDFFDFANSYAARTAIGPASAMGKYLKLIGWKLEDNGTITGPHGLSCNLFHNSTKEICGKLHAGWSYYVHKSIDHRKGVSEKCFDCQLTSKVYQSFPPTEQMIIALNMIGGFQTGYTRQFWDKDSDGKCEFCDALDGRYHRMMECEAFHIIREKHKHVIEILQNEYPEWVYLPIAQQHPDIQLLRLTNESRQLPEGQPISNIENQTDTPHFRFWTDGACSNPTQTEARLSTWAVVVDNTVTLEQRANIVQSINSVDSSLDTLQCHMLGNTPGSQTAARAELCAVIQACVSAQATDPNATSDIFTDASYVVKTINSFEQNLCIEKPHKKSNMDLVDKLKQVWKVGQYAIHKVKAHRNFAQSSNDEDAWAILANHVADRSADAALQNEIPEIRMLAEDICEHKVQQFQKLRFVLVYILELNLLRMKLQREKQTDVNPRIHGIALETEQSGPLEAPSDPYAIAFQKLMDWNPNGYVTLFDEPLPVCVQDACSLGRSIAQTFWIWWQKIQWPPDAETAEYDFTSDWGISYLELVISFGLSCQVLFPIPINPGERIINYIPYYSDEAALLPKHHRSANNQTFAMEKLIRQLQNLSKVKIIPDFGVLPKRPCLSLQRLGFHNKVSGLPRRPIIPKAQETLHCVKAYLNGLKEQSLDQPLDLPKSQPLIPHHTVPELTPQERFNAAARLRKSLAKNR